FAVTLSASVLVSMAVVLTLTPMMCARLLHQQDAAQPAPSRVARWLEAGFDALLRGYRRSLSWALAHGRLMVVLLVATIGLNVYLYAVVPKGFFPRQDTGQLIGIFRVDQ